MPDVPFIFLSYQNNNLNNLGQVINTTIKMGLDKYEVFAIDTNPNSTYFKVSEFPATLTAGKNYFLLDGTSALKAGSEIKVEALDSNGDPLYVEIPDTLINGTSRVVSIYVYDGTPLGNATITILGVLDDVPDDWKNTYNVKWQRSVKINTVQGDDQPAFLLDEPIVDLEEIYDVSHSFSQVFTPVTLMLPAVSMSFSSSMSASVTQSFTSSFYTGISGQPIGTQYGANSYYVLVSPTHSFVSDMINGNIYVPNPGISSSLYSTQSFNASVVDLLTSNMAIVTPAYSASNVRTQTDQVVKFYPSEYTMSYNVRTVFTGSGNPINSYIRIKIRNITTLSGIVKFVDLYKQPGNEFLGRYPVKANQMIVSGSTFNGIEDFYGNWEPVSQSYGREHSMLSASYDPATLFGSVKLEVTTSPFIQFSPLDLGSSSVAIWLDAYNIPTSSNNQFIDMWQGKDPYGNSAVSASHTDQVFDYTRPTFQTSSLSTGLPGVVFGTNTDYRFEPKRALEITASNSWMSSTASIYVVGNSPVGLYGSRPAGSVLGNRNARNESIGFHAMYGYPYTFGATNDQINGTAVGFFNNFSNYPLNMFMMSFTNASGTMYNETPSASLVWANSSSATWLPPTTVSYGANPTWSLFVGGAFDDMAPNLGYWGGSWFGSIHEIIVFNRSLTQWEHEKVQGYLAWKWGLQGKGLYPTHSQKASMPYRPTGSNPEFRIYNDSELRFNKDVEYQVSAKLYTSASSVPNDPQLRMYITSSNGPVAFRDTDYHGRLISTSPVRKNTITYYKTNFRADYDGTGSLLLVPYPTSSVWNIADVSIKPFQSDNFSISEFEFVIPNPIRRNDKFSLTTVLIGGDGKPVNTKYVKANSKNTTGRSLYQSMTGSNLVISHTDNLIEGSLFVGKNLRTGVQIDGFNYAMIRSIGYEGFGEATAGPPPLNDPTAPGHGLPGFVIFSGSILPGTIGDDMRQTYEGIGLELHGGGHSGSLRFRVDSTGSFLEVSGSVHMQTGSFSGIVFAGPVQIGYGVGGNSGSKGIWLNQYNYWIFQDSTTGSGQVSKMTLTDSGGGYRPLDLVYFSGSSQSQLFDQTATALVKSINFWIQSASISSASIGSYVAPMSVAFNGSGYRKGDFLKIPGGDSSASLVVNSVMTRSVQTAIMIGSGSGYTDGNILTLINGPGGNSGNVGQPAQIKIIDTSRYPWSLGMIVHYQIMSPGQGYVQGLYSTNVTGSIGTGATFYLTVTPSGSAKSVSIINSGYGYDPSGSVPVISLGNPSASGLKIDIVKAAEIRDLIFPIDRGTSYITGSYSLKVLPVYDSFLDEYVLTSNGAGATANIDFVDLFHFRAGDQSTKLEANTDGVTIVAEKATLSGSQVSIKTPNFHLGSDSTYVHGENGIIEISSSNFTVNKDNKGISSFTGRIVADDGLFSGKLYAGSVEIGNHIGPSNTSIATVGISSASIGEVSRWWQGGEFVAGEYATVLAGLGNAIVRIDEVQSNPLGYAQINNRGIEYQKGQLLTVRNPLTSNTASVLVTGIEGGEGLGSISSIQIVYPGSNYAEDALTEYQLVSSTGLGSGATILGASSQQINVPTRISLIDGGIGYTVANGVATNPITSSTAFGLTVDITAITTIGAAVTSRGIFIDNSNYWMTVGTASYMYWINTASYADGLPGSINSWIFINTGSGYSVGDTLYAYQNFTSSYSQSLLGTKYYATMSSSTDAIGTVAGVQSGIKSINYASGTINDINDTRFSWTWTTSGSFYTASDQVKVLGGDNNATLRINTVYLKNQGIIISASLVSTYYIDANIGEILYITGSSLIGNQTASVLVLETSSLDTSSASLRGAPLKIQLLSGGRGYSDTRFYVLAKMGTTPDPTSTLVPVVRVKIADGSVGSWTVLSTGSGYAPAAKLGTSVSNKPRLTGQAGFAIAVDAIDAGITSFQFEPAGSRYYAGQTASLQGGNGASASIFVRFTDTPDFRIGNTASFFSGSYAGVRVKTNDFFLGGSVSFLSGSTVSKSFEMSSSAFYMRNDGTISPGKYEIPRSIFYGDGIDGSITLSVVPDVARTGSGGSTDIIFNITSSQWWLQRDVYLRDLVLTAGTVGSFCTLNSNGYRILVNNSCSLGAYSVIQNNGSNGGDGGNGSTTTPGASGTGGRGGGDLRCTLARRDGTDGGSGGVVGVLNQTAITASSILVINATASMTITPESLSAPSWTMFSAPSAAITASVVKATSLVTASVISASSGIDTPTVAGVTTNAAGLSAGHISATSTFTFDNGAAGTVLTSSGAGNAVWAPKW